MSSQQAKVQCPVCERKFSILPHRNPFHKYKLKCGICCQESTVQILTATPSNTSNSQRKRRKTTHTSPESQRSGNVNTPNAVPSRTPPGNTSETRSLETTSLETTSLETSSLETTEEVQQRYSPNTNSWFKCPYCKSSSRGELKLQRHVEVTHVGVNPFGCTLCGERYLRESDFRIHLKTHTAKEALICRYCTTLHHSAMQLQQHEWIHTGEKPYICRLCNYKCAQKSNLVTHDHKHMRLPQPLPPNPRPQSARAAHCFECPYCTDAFSRETHLKQHVVGIHVTEQAFGCTYCGRRYLDEDDFKLHLRTHGGHRPSQCRYCDDLQYTSTMQLQQHEWTHTGEKPYTCKHCDYKSAQKSNLVTHGLKHVVGLSGLKERAVNITGHLQCPYCKSVFAVEQYLQRHVKRMHVKDKPFGCTFCGERYVEEEFFMHHLKAHIGKRTSICRYCGVCESSVGMELQSHEWVHTGEKPYACQFCAYKCANKSRLMTHGFMHIGKSCMTGRFECPYCGMVFNKEKFLQHHVEGVHVGRKGFGCTYCGDRFRREKDFIVHLQEHGGRMKRECRYCGERHAYSVMHEWVHTGERPYVCPYCDFKSAGKDSLTAHRGKHITVTEALDVE